MGRSKGFSLNEKGGSPGLVCILCQGSAAEYLVWVFRLRLRGGVMGLLSSESMSSCAEGPGRGNGKAGMLGKATA